MARTPFVAGNWKLNLGPAAAAELAQQLRQELADRGRVTVAVFPTALAISAVQPVLSGSEIGVGVQEIEAKASGALTGGNSAVMAREAGCAYTLVGHSERRQLWGETDASCAAKLLAALEAGLLPVLCVGETLQERQAGRVTEVVHGQIERGLAHLNPDQVATLTLAYEPVWAIGTGETASPAQAQEVHSGIRQWLTERYGAGVANDMRILYGGSVKPGNAVELLGQADIDGALVGGAALKAESFRAIVQAAVATA